MEKQELIKKYSDIIPNDLKFIIKVLNEPKDDLDWALIAYIFQNSGKGIVTLSKVSSYFNLDQKKCFEKLNNLAGFWISQYLNNSGYKIYYSYEMNLLSADILVSVMGAISNRIQKSCPETIKKRLYCEKR